MTFQSRGDSEAPVADDGRQPEDAETARIAAALKGRNISQTTFLATDYLNHLNEIIMLLELVPDMPECLEDAKEWQPKSYAWHFQDSGFSDAALAIQAYEHAPARYRLPFDETVVHFNAVAAEGLARIEAAVEAGDTDRLGEVATQVCTQLRRLTDTANGIIHGSGTTVDQAEIDRFFAG